MSDTAENPSPSTPAPAPAEAAKRPPEKLNAKAAGIIGLAVMSSRILGLLRELIFAALFGAGKSMDAFVVAFRTPNLLRDMFAEGALSTAFVTVFSKKVATDGDESAWKLANKVATLTAVFMSVLVIVGITIAPALVKLFAPGFDPAKAALTAMLARIMYPFILLVSLAALTMGMLNAKNVFAAPAMASSFFNLGSIAGGVAIGWYLDPTFGERALIGLALGTLIGGALQLLVQFPALLKVGFRLRPDFDWKDDCVRKILFLMGPAVLAASSVQINVMINSMFASTLGDGPISWLQIAFRLMQLPLGVFGVAIGTVVLPVVSRSAAAENWEEFRSILSKGIRLALLMTIPSTIGLMMLAEPIISLIYERGKFTTEMMQQTAAGLQFYAIGLCAYAGMKVLAPAFYAIDKRLNPMIVSFASIGLNLLLNWIFTFQFGWGHRGLALSTGCVALTNFVALYIMMRSHMGRLETRQLVVTIAKLLVAGAGLAGVCWFADRWWLHDWHSLSFLLRTAGLLGTIAVAGAVYFGLALLLRVGELDDIRTIVERKLKRRRA